MGELVVSVDWILIGPMAGANLLTCDVVYRWPKAVRILKSLRVRAPMW